MYLLVYDLLLKLILSQYHCSCIVVVIKLVHLITVVIVVVIKLVHLITVTRRNRPYTQRTKEGWRTQPCVWSLQSSELECPCTKNVNERGHTLLLNHGGMPRWLSLDTE
jgi:hypothetical protein